MNPVLLEFDPGSAATTLPQLDVQPPLPAGTFTWQCFFLILPTGQMLLSAQDSTLFLYTPDPATSAPKPAWKPAHISLDAHMTLGHSYTVRGTQINGLSQAACYGDDGGMASNYPIVRLTHPATGQVVYVRSHDFSTMGASRAMSRTSRSWPCAAGGSTGASRWTSTTIRTVRRRSACWIETVSTSSRCRFEA